MRNVEQFIEEIIRLKSLPDPTYGGNVLPAIKLYGELRDSKEKQAYQSALEVLLRDPDENLRNHAVDLCLGFFVFRDSI